MSFDVPGMKEIGTCDTCVYYKPRSYGTWCDCEKFIFGYADSGCDGRSSWREHADDEAAIEDDEAWGFVPGPRFGCIHWRFDAF